MWSPLGPTMTAPLQTAHCWDKDGCPGTRTAVQGWHCRISGPNDMANRFMAAERKSPSLNQVTPQLTPHSCKQLWGVLHLKHESGEQRDPSPQLAQRAEQQPHNQRSVQTQSLQQHFPSKSCKSTNLERPAEITSWDSVLLQVKKQHLKQLKYRPKASPPFLSLLPFISSHQAPSLACQHLL